MENIKSLKETVAHFVDVVDKIKDATSVDVVSKLELEALRSLQLAEVQVGEASRDLYIAVMNQKADIRAGKVAIVKEVKPETEQKPNTKKKATKKAKK